MTYRQYNKNRNTIHDTSKACAESVGLFIIHERHRREFL